jgi:hypothetical protein
MIDLVLLAHPLTTPLADNHAIHTAVLSTFFTIHETVWALPLSAFFTIHETVWALPLSARSAHLKAICTDRLAAGTVLDAIFPQSPSAELTGAVVARTRIDLVTRIDAHGIG